MVNTIMADSYPGPLEENRGVYPSIIIKKMSKTTNFSMDTLFLNSFKQNPLLSYSVFSPMAVLSRILPFYRDLKMTIEMFAEIIMTSAGAVLLYYIDRAEKHGWPLGRISIQYGHLICFCTLIYSIIVLFVKYGLDNAVLGLIISFILYIIPSTSIFKEKIQSICYFAIIICFLISISTF
jgi:hypothetical protein